HGEYLGGLAAPELLRGKRLQLNRELLPFLVRAERLQLRITQQAGRLKSREDLALDFGVLSGREIARRSLDLLGLREQHLTVVGLFTKVCLNPCRLLRLGVLKLLQRLHAEIARTLSGTRWGRENRRHIARSIERCLSDRPLCARQIGRA